MTVKKLPVVLPQLTARAIRAVKWIWERLPSEINSADHIPIFTWCEVVDTNGSHEEIGLGVDLRISVPSDFILLQGGLEVAMGFPEEIFQMYRGHAIDYEKRRFKFVLAKE